MFALSRVTAFNMANPFNKSCNAINDANNDNSQMVNTLQ